MSLRHVTLRAFAIVLVFGAVLAVPAADAEPSCRGRVHVANYTLVFDGWGVRDSCVPDAYCDDGALPCVG